MTKREFKIDRLCEDMNELRTHIHMLSDKISELMQLLQPWIAMQSAPASIYELVAEATKIAGKRKSISTSLVQRNLGVGYARACRLIDMLEAGGLIGPKKSGGLHAVLMQDKTSIK